jgi:RNA polymerase sigma-70 factor, ECF subfamily
MQQGGEIPESSAPELRPSDTAQTEKLLERALEGDRQAVGDLLELHRQRLCRMVELRLDDRLRGRLSASDVVQDAYLEAVQRLPEYLRSPAMPFFLWLRLITGQKLMGVHQYHFGVQMRDPRREVSLYHGALPAASSEALAAHLLGRHTTPSEAAVRAELKVRLQEVLNTMDAIDREVLALRHFEQLSNTEVAHVLGIQESAASKRYLRAAKKFREILAGTPGGWGNAGK